MRIYAAQRQYNPPHMAKETALIQKAVSFDILCIEQGKGYKDKHKGQPLQL